MPLRYPRKTDPGHSRRCYFRSADATSTAPMLLPQATKAPCGSNEAPPHAKCLCEIGGTQTQAIAATKLRIFFPPWEKPQKALKRTKNTQNAPYSPEKVRFGPIPALFRTPKLLTKQFRPQRTKKIFFTFIIDNSLGSTFLRLKNRFSRRKIGYFPKKMAL